MINKNIITFLMFFPMLSMASTWEYKVVFLPGTATGTKVTLEKSGAYLDGSKTKILNKLGKAGWELISVTGDSGSDHALYMKREQKR